MQGAQSPLAEHDLAGTGRRVTGQQGEETASVQRIDTDRRDGLAADVQLPVVAAGIPADGGLSRQDLAEHRSGHASELQVELLVPVLPVPVGGADQGDQARPEDQGRQQRRQSHCRHRERAAHRDGTAAAAGLERHSYPDAAGHRPGHGQGLGQPGTAEPAARPGHAQRAVRAPGHAPGHRGQQHQRRDRDDGQTGAQDGQVDLDAGARLGQPGRPDGHQRRRRDRDGHGEACTAAGHRAGPGQKQRSQPGPGHPEGAQNGKLRRIQDELAANELAEYHERENRGQRGEHGQADGLRADRLLRRTRLPGQVREAERPGGRVTSGQRAGRGGERGEAHARPQPHVCGITRAEPPALTSPPESGTQQHPRRAAQARRGHHLVIEGDDRRYPEGQRDRAALGRAGRSGRAYLRRARHTEQVQRAARPQPLTHGQLLVDHDSRRVGRGRPPPGQDSHPVRGPPERAVRAGDRFQLPGWRTATAWDGQLIDDLGGHRRDLRQPGECGIETAQADAAGDDLNVGGVAPAQQPRVGGGGAAGAIRCGQRYPADQAKEQRQPERRPPALPQPGAEEERDASHGAAGRYSARSTVAGLIRAAARPGHAAISAASASGDRDGGQYQRDRDAGAGARRRRRRRTAPTPSGRPGGRAARRSAGRSRPA